MAIFVIIESAHIAELLGSAHLLLKDLKYNHIMEKIVGVEWISNNNNNSNNIFSKSISHYYSNNIVTKIFRKQEQVSI